MRAGAPSEWVDGGGLSRKEVEMTVEIAQKPQPAADGGKSFTQKLLDGVEKVSKSATAT